MTIKEVPFSELNAQLKTAATDLKKGGLLVNSIAESLLAAATMLDKGNLEAAQKFSTLAEKYLNEMRGSSEKSWNEKKERIVKSTVTYGRVPYTKEEAAEQKEKDDKTAQSFSSAEKAIGIAKKAIEQFAKEKKFSKIH